MTGMSLFTLVNQKYTAQPVQADSQANVSNVSVLFSESFLVSFNDYLKNKRQVTSLNQYERLS